MKRLLSSLLALIALGALLTGCAIHPRPMSGHVMVGTDGGDRHDNGRHRGHEKQKHKHKNKHGHDD